MVFIKNFIFAEYISQSSATQKLLYIHSFWNLEITDFQMRELPWDLTLNPIKHCNDLICLLSSQKLKDSTLFKQGLPTQTLEGKTSLNFKHRYRNQAAIKVYIMYWSMMFLKPFNNPISNTNHLRSELQQKSSIKSGPYTCPPPVHLVTLDPIELRNINY